MQSHLPVGSLQSAWELHLICCTGHGPMILEWPMGQAQALQTLGWGWEAKAHLWENPHLHCPTLRRMFANTVCKRGD